MSIDTVPFPLLADASGYRACLWDLRADADRRGYWSALYRKHFPPLVAEAVKVAVADGATARQAGEQTEACIAAFGQYLDAVERDPQQFDVLDIHEMAIVREAMLRRHGFTDAYRLVKQRETAAALRLLPALLADLDGLDDDRQRAVRIIEGCFAGNIFDVGASETLALFNAGKLDFHATRAKLAPRPWRIDDLDAWARRLTTGPAWRWAVLFVDNAGFDVVLGMIPLARDLLRRGCGVIMAANTTPALNDITHDELVVLLGDAAAVDDTIAAALRDGRLEAVASGNGTPLIDLKRIAPQLAQRVRQRSVDLVVIEGMGRAVESNLNARFTCDALKIAMIKDPDVAQAVGGKVYDLVLRYEPAQNP